MQTVHAQTRRNGFTLIEIIATMILVGILAVTGGMFLTETTRGFILTRENSEASQKMDLAIMRIERELREVISVHELGSKTGENFSAISFERPSGPRTIYFENNAIRVGNGKKIATAKATSHILIDNITDFHFSPRTGDDALWSLSDDKIEELCSFNLTLSYNNEVAANALTITSTVLPRNNNNTGGAVVPMSGGIPDYPTSGCFVATATCGNDTHPMVAALRAFRDKCLLTCAPGRAFVKFYYTYGPTWAAYIAGNSILQNISYIALLPLTGLALMLLWSTWGTAFILVMVPILIHTIGLGRSKRIRRLKSLHSQQGSLLLSVIGALVFAGILGGAMVPMFSTALDDQVVMNQGSRTFYLAESGYNVAAYRYIKANDKDDELVKLHGSEFTLANGDGSFSLEVYPRWMNVSTNPSGNTITAEIPGGREPDFPRSSGKVEINGQIYDYSLNSVSRDQVKATVSMTLSGGDISAISGGNLLSMVAMAKAQSLTNSGSNLILQSGAEAFPELNGAFIVQKNNTTYTYTKRDGNTLYDVRRADDPVGQLAISLDSPGPLILDKFISIRSTGTLGEASHSVTYNTPIGWLQQAGADDSVPLTQKFNEGSMANFAHGTSSKNHLGTHSASGGALKVDSASNGWSHLAVSPNSGNRFNWHDIWMANGKTLTYDAQVKINIPSNQLYWMTGLDFRNKGSLANGDHSCYGISLVRLRVKQEKTRHKEWYKDYYGSRPWQWKWNWRWVYSWHSIGFDDGISNSLIPKDLIFNPSVKHEIFDEDPNDDIRHIYSRPALVLWYSNLQYNGRYSHWIAYKMLDESSGIITTPNGDYDYRLKPWSTLALRIIEGLPYRFYPNRNDQAKPTMGATFSINEGQYITRLAGEPTPESRNGYQNRFYWVLFKGFNTPEFPNRGPYRVTFTNKDGSSGSGRLEYGSDRYEPTNFIRVYLSSTTNNGSPDSNMRNDRRKAIPRDTIIKFPTEEDSVNSSNDWLTLIKWDAMNRSVRWDLTPSHNAYPFDIVDDVIMDHDWNITWSERGQAPTQEVGLHTHGTDEAATGIQFDDFNIRAWMNGQNKGFRPPIMQSN